MKGCTLLCTLIWVWGSLLSPSIAMFEDQIGKFDWHQKYFGHVQFLLNDLNQPKRVIVGTRDNIIGAINSNTGAILYRHVLESNSELLYLNNFEDKSILAVSSHDNQVKVRTFATSTGIQRDEWIVKQELTHAAEFNRNIYLIDTKTKFPSVGISSYQVKGDKRTDASHDEQNDIEETKGESVLKLVGSKQVVLGLNQAGVCQVASPYLVCAKGNKVSVVNFVDGTVRNHEFSEAGDIAEISATSSAELTVVAFKGKGFVKICRILQNSQSGPELMPISYPVGAFFPSLSQAKVEDQTVLFITRLETAHLIQMDAYNTKLEKIPEHSIQVKASMLISSLGVAKGFCYNGQCGLVGFTKDELLFGTKLEAAANNVKVSWSRQECLASVLSVEMVDYPSEAGHSWNPYSTQQGLISGFIARVKFEIETFVTGESFYSSNDDRFGARKVIVFVTSVGKVLGMDGLTGQILYTFILPEFSVFSDSSVFLYIQRPAKYLPLKPLATILYASSRSDKTSILFPFNPVEGEHLGEPQTFPGIVQSQMLLHGTEDTSFLKPVLMLDSNNIVHTFPSGFADVDNVFFFLAEKSESPVLKGFGIKPDPKTKKLGANALWDLSIGKSNLIGVYGKLPCERIHSQGRVLPDRSVSYKYMNPNLVAVFTSEPEAGNINVFLVDAVSGAVIHSFWHKKSRGPVHVVHSEHWLVYSLFNEKFRRYEVTSVELYEGQTQSNSSAFSSFASPSVAPIVLKQSYIFPSKIESMSYTRTDKGITNKDILIGLPTGGILELPRFVLQPRISAQHHQIHQDEDGVIHSVPYIPELPVPPEMIINYNQSVKRVRGIKTWPTRLESTCLVLVYGNDIFYTKVAPSKHFDVLKDDFDHWFIMIVLSALCIAAYATKRLTARKQLEQAWR